MSLEQRPFQLQRIDGPGRASLGNHHHVVWQTHIVRLHIVGQALRPHKVLPALRALIRDRERKGPSSLRRPLVQDLMCGIEDVNDADLRGLVNYLRGRGEAEEDYPVLADWIERVFL